jgi:phosphatidylinositol glycan class B
VLIFSVLLDRAFYNQWTFPPYRFLYFNIAQSLAVFYGRNRWDYYLTEGYPLLLTTYLPFALFGLYRALQASHTTSSSATIRPQLATVAIIVPAVLSLVSHKEVRFIYPLLPILHVLAADPITSFIRPSPSDSRHGRPPWRSTLLPLLLLLNVLIALLTTQYHQPAPLKVMDYLRHEHEKQYLTQPPVEAHLPPADSVMTVGFLMPCHSTPWRSHLVHPGIRAWALGCEPPIHLDPSQRQGYLDEADQFYESPQRFLMNKLGKPPARKNMLGGKMPQTGLGSDVEAAAWDGKEGKKVWPEYLVFFQGLEKDLRTATKDSGYGECWRGWNSYFHDDWRRTGDMIVWCLRTKEERRGGTGNVILSERQRSSNLFH